MVVLILAAVEVCVRDDLLYELQPNSHAQAPIEIFDFGFELVNSPEVIVFGNSLIIHAISMFEITKLAAADDDFLLNLSLGAGVMTDYLWLYKLYHDKFKNADTLVIGINLRSFDNGASREPTNPSRFRRYASLTQRLSINDRSDRISLLVGSIWKTWDARQQIGGYIKWHKGQVLKDIRNIIGRNFEWTGKPEIDELGRIANVTVPITSTEVDDIIRYVAKSDYTFTKGIQFEAFLELIRMARDDSLDIILLDAPASDVYLRNLNIYKGDEIGKLNGAIENETGISIIRIGLTEDDCPTIDDCFIDYGHLNPNGSKIYSRLFL